MALLFALAESAQVANVLERGGPGAAKPKRPECQQIQDARSRLAQALGINRQLHSALAEKKRMLEQAKEESMRLQRQVECWKSMEQERQTIIKECESPEVQPSKVARENAKMASQIEAIEERICAQNDRNLQLSEKHRGGRARMAELQGRLRTLARRDRELAKQINFLAEGFNEILAEEEEEAIDRQVNYAGSVKDYKSLPGLSLSKILGRSLQQPQAVPGVPTQDQKGSSHAVGHTRSPAEPSLPDGSQRTARQDDSRLMVPPPMLPSPPSGQPPTRSGRHRDAS